MSARSRSAKSPPTNVERTVKPARGIAIQVMRIVLNSSRRAAPGVRPYFRAPLRPLLPVLAAFVAVLAVGASDGTADRSAGATARAWAIKVIVPGQAGAS